MLVYYYCINSIESTKLKLLRSYAQGRLAPFEFGCYVSTIVINFFSGMRINACQSYEGPTDDFVVWMREYYSNRFHNEMSVTNRYHSVIMSIVNVALRCCHSLSLDASDNNKTKSVDTTFRNALLLFPWDLTLREKSHGFFDGACGILSTVQAPLWLNSAIIFARASQFGNYCAVSTCLMYERGNGGEYDRCASPSKRRFHSLLFILVYSAFCLHFSALQ